MCGLAGVVDLHQEGRADYHVLARMTDTLVHRGPDSSGYFVEPDVCLGLRRLKIIDLESGDQPLYNEDGTVVAVCNGEIFNFRELKEELINKGHVFRTRTDVEVLPHLYEEEGSNLCRKLNGQFAFAIYDKKEKRLLIARDHFEIVPLYLTMVDGLFIFASEIKALLEHPSVRREVDLTGIDQLLSLPGLASPRTIFKNIESLRGGHFISISHSDIKIRKYWDLDYPRIGEVSYDRPESYYVEGVRELLTQSVRSRLQADVPVGVYLSGGLDSSMVATLIQRISPDTRRHSFSVSFTEKEICEAKYQRLMAAVLGSEHHEIVFGYQDIAERLQRAVYHAECPFKEAYNTASFALSETARAHGVKVVLNGEGADELFAGYVGYRLDQMRAQKEVPQDLETILEDEIREKLWGDKNVYFEKHQFAYEEIKRTLFSEALNEIYPDFNYFNYGLVDHEQLRGRHYIHQRSYLDFKLRLGGHLISDHGDRMAMGNSVEARYPFLDINLVDFSRLIPPDLKLHKFTEKYILKKAGEGLLPSEITSREKFAFIAPGSPSLLRRNFEWINDLLSYERVKRQGYINPDTVESLKKRYSEQDFRLNIPFDDDLLMIVLTFGMLLDLFKLPSLG